MPDQISLYSDIMSDHSKKLITSMIINIVQAEVMKM